MTRLVMGNKPSPAISIVAMHETAMLEDNASKYPAAFDSIVRNGYVDNIFCMGPDLQ